ncbi:MAG: TerC family protein [Xanthomonadaceae bacterium]|nr:TerC family protein [Xanthomonadaceae bacterium]
MEWLTDPTIWMGLATLIVLEIILGIDNLVFIAILVDKLPPRQRDKARLIGLSLTLIMRLALLATLSWIMRLTAPLFAIAGRPVSGRDLILLGGGLFLLFKATMELHERLEGSDHHADGGKAYASFGMVVAQVVILDAVFSLDSIITAVGMVDELGVMMAAVIVAILIMMAASKPLTVFVNRHPTVVILCLGFLLMIGFSLTAEGFGFMIPKGYLYAAIAFSLLIEMFNQWSRFNRERAERKLPLRQRTADAVMRLLGGRMQEDHVAAAAQADAAVKRDAPGLEETEREMIRSVLSLAERPITSLMTVRAEIAWIDPSQAPQQAIECVVHSPHSRLLACNGELDQVRGVVQARDLLADVLTGKGFSVETVIREPLFVPESASTLSVLERIREHPVPMAVVVDEYGSVEGLVTANDLLAAIAGDLIDTQDAGYGAEPGADGSWLLDGAMPIEEAERAIGIALPHNPAYQTLSGLVVYVLDRMPNIGDSIDVEGYRLDVVSLQHRRVHKLRISPVTV